MSNQQGGAYLWKSRHRNCPHATWTVLASLLLNLDETLTRD